MDTMSFFLILYISLVSGQGGSTPKPPCRDHLQEHNCPIIDGVCSNPLAKDICPRYCNLCDETKDHVLTTQPSASRFVTKPPCPTELHEDMCHTIPGVCTDAFAPVTCPRFCGLCDPTTTAPQFVTKPPCPDDVKEEDLCHTVQDVCTNELAPVTCPRYCGLCDPTTTVAVTQKTLTTLPTTTAEITAIKTTTACPDTNSACCSVTEICTSNPLAASACPNRCRGIITTAPTTTYIVTTTKVPTTTHISSTRRLPTTNHHVHHTKHAVSRMCYQCGDIDKNIPCSTLEMAIGQPTPCDKGAYCMTDVRNSKDGMTSDTFKRCVTRGTCERQWYDETSDQVACVNYDATNLFAGLLCHFCCKQDGCNAATVPDRSTLFKP